MTGNAFEVLENDEAARSRGTNGDADSGESDCDEDCPVVDLAELLTGLELDDKGYAKEDVEAWDNGSDISDEEFE